MTSYAHDSSNLAEAYDRLSDSQFEAGQRLVEGLRLNPGSSVLDIGCGTGRLAHWLRERLGPGGRVVGIDPLPDRVAIARARNAGIQFEVGHAEDLAAFEDESFDAVCLSAVFHWIVDKPKALAEIRRVLRPGGLVGATTLPQELRLASTMAAVCGPVFERSPYRERANRDGFAIIRQSLPLTEMVTMILKSRLDLVLLKVVERRRTHATGHAVVDFVESSSFGNFLGIVPEELRPGLRDDLAAALDELKGPDGIVMRDHGMVFVARRP
jgi:ubiquinone/menaquinone biosynthesis C-methylase UbiE